MGKEVSGSDLSPEMVDCGNRNLAWLSENYGTPHMKVVLSDALTVALPKKIDSIVSEGYLGPVIVTQKPSEHLKDLAVQSDRLLKTALGNWAGQLAPGSKVCLAAPSWHSRGGNVYPSIVDEPHIDGYNRLSLKGIDQDNLTYRRDNQYVGRTLILLERK